MWWNVPAQTWFPCSPINDSRRRTISRAARRVKVTSMIEPAGTPVAIR